jgi:hypothetical protein
VAARPYHEIEILVSLDTRNIYCGDNLEHLAGHSSASESGAKDTRSPDASRLPDTLKLREASGLRRVHRRF